MRLHFDNLLMKIVKIVFFFLIKQGINYLFKDSKLENNFGIFVFCGFQIASVSYDVWNFLRIVFLQQPAINVLKEIQSFLEANPTEIVTIIIEDYVTSPKGLTKVFDAAGLRKYWFPVSRMPKNGGDWPTVDDMIHKNQRLVVFTSKASKEAVEGIAYEWRYVVENQCQSIYTVHLLLSRLWYFKLIKDLVSQPRSIDLIGNLIRLCWSTIEQCSISNFDAVNLLRTDGNGGMKAGTCPNRSESAAMNTKSRSLVVVNYFRDVPDFAQTCKHNSAPLLGMVNTCYEAAGKRWANFIAVDFYKV